MAPFFAHPRVHVCGANGRCPLQRHHLYTPLAVGSPPVDLGNLA